MICSIQVNLYFNKLINTNTNEVISILPIKKCAKCKSIPDNIETSELANKDLICNHIVDIVRENINNSFNLKNDVIYIKLSHIYDIFKSIDKTLEYSDRSIQFVYKTL